MKDHLQYVGLLVGIGVLRGLYYFTNSMASAAGHIHDALTVEASALHEKTDPKTPNKDSIFN